MTPPPGPPTPDPNDPPWPPEEGRRVLVPATRTTAHAWLARKCVSCGKPLDQAFYARCVRCRAN
jgi:hypothetical protein